MAVREGGRAARTAYEVVGTFREPELARLECRLETGRTHQIRVHLQAIGHPVVGDAAYGGQRAAIAIDRPFLHAGGLRFAHPVTGVPVAVQEPLAPELAALLDHLGG
jgi:23S rRNA pseudouridine1911/1915/1917 synthase